MAKPKVFVTRKMDQAALDLLSEATEMDLWPDEYPPSVTVLRQRIRPAEGVLVTVMDRVDAAFFDAAPRLKVVSTIAVGYDNIDVAEATRRGIPVGHTPSVLNKATADFAFGLLLAAARRIVESDRYIRAKRWKLTYHPQYWLGHDVHNATLGIIGLGQIGTEVAKRALGFDMKVAYYSVPRKEAKEQQYGFTYMDLPTLLRTCDFISIHVPLLPQTRRLIGEAQLRMMKPSAILVNTSRGPVVDQKALYRALKEGWISGAGLDVSDPEPIPDNEPLLELDNVVITPHIASSGMPSRKETALLSARNLIAGLKAERLPACANPEVYTRPKP